MTKPAWTPWHKVVDVRDDLRSGELSLSIFAADLYDVIMGKAKPVYQDPAQFFALTYPTFNLRELAKDVVQRLAGKNDKAIRQLQLTYGGGKTHALITLNHLVSEPSKLPNLPAVDEFVQHIGFTPPKSRVAVLAFDKLDVEKGMEIRDPKGRARWLKQPWSVLAWQIAGPDGLRSLHAEGKDEERDSAPAENLLTDLLKMPEKEGLSTLILIDEVLMYAREKVSKDPAWRSRVQNFFQYLAQAATKVDKAAMVASLLASDPRKSDTLGKEITQELFAIFRRQQEEGVEPVVKEDVAEVLRRRFFKAESIRDREAFRPHVVAAIKGITELDDQTRKDGKSAEDRYVASYPFHPDLTEVFYSKWTQLEGFQRARGVLRTFALALRDAEKWDTSPLVSTNVFLTAPGKDGISEALRELTTVAATEEYEGKRQEWTGILDGELTKAKQIQQEAVSLKFREPEQAVIATFIHSQPPGKKALTRELLVLLGHSRPDKIEIEKALLKWTELSWFLDEAAISEALLPANGKRELPKSWRLGSKPNLKQMHFDACQRVLPELIDTRLLDDISKTKSLTAGASGSGAGVHNLPERPRDIDDDGQFRYAVLGPRAASESGKPSPEAKRFIDETTGPDRPRIYRNAIVLAVPSRDGLEAARDAIRAYIGWEEVRSQLKGQELDPIREQTLAANIEAARKRIPEAIQQAYCIVVTVSDKNEVQAFRVNVGSDPLFATIKSDPRARIQETAINAEALLPDGPYNLWRSEETSRRVKDLVGAFAQFPHLPKMLNRQALVDTIVLGCREGQFVLQSTRPDRSTRTFWMQQPDDADLKDPGLELVLPKASTLAQLPPSVLAPGVLPGLWAKPALTFREIADFFSGGRVVKVQKNGYEEPFTVPGVPRAVLLSTTETAIRDGKLWLTSGPTSIFREDIPSGILTDDATLNAPPDPIPVTSLSPENLPEGWSDGKTTALALTVACSKRSGKTLPWTIIRDAIEGALRVRIMETATDSGPWPCDASGARNVRLQIPQEVPASPPTSYPPSKLPGVLVAEAELRPSQIQDLSETIGDLLSASVGHDLKFRLRVELSAGKDGSPADDVATKIKKILGDISPELDLR